MSTLLLLLATYLGAQPHPVEEFLRSLEDSPRLRGMHMAQQAQLTSGDARTMGMDLRVGYEVMDPDNPDMRTHQFQIKQELTGILTNPLEREKGLLRSRMAALETEK